MRRLGDSSPASEPEQCDGRPALWRASSPKTLMYHLVRSTYDMHQRGFIPNGYPPVFSHDDYSEHAFLVYSIAMVTDS